MGGGSGVLSMAAWSLVMLSLRVRATVARTRVDTVDRTRGMTWVRVGYLGEVCGRPQHEDPEDGGPAERSYAFTNQAAELAHLGL